VRVKCLVQEHNTMSPARARTRTTRSGVELTNHEATAPLMRPPWGGSQFSGNLISVLTTKLSNILGRLPSTITALSGIICFTLELSLYRQCSVYAGCCYYHEHFLIIERSTCNEQFRHQAWSQNTFPDDHSFCY